jgi:hypothetical protein
MQKLAIQLHPSKWFNRCQTVLLLTSLVVIFYLPAPGWFKFSLLPVVILYSLFIFYRHRALRALSHDDQGWQLQTADGLFEAALCGDSTVTTWVSILRFKLPGHAFKRSYVLFHDAMRADQYRKLIVHARWLSK